MAEYDALVVGGGVAGLTAATFLARAGLSTLVANHGESILRRNAHLENFPGFPAGVNSMTFADMLEAQADRNGAERLEAKVVDVSPADAAFASAAAVEPTGTVRAASDDPGAYAVPDAGEEANEDPAGDDGDDANGDADVPVRGPDAPGFVVTVESGDELTADRVLAASWADSGYLEGLGVKLRDAGSKQYIRTDGSGRTNVPGLYAAGRLAEGYHQAIVSAGHGAQVAITLIHDSETPFYNDWVATEGYFTGRGREVPPGCEEIDEEERLRRERESMSVMTEYFAEPHPGRQRTHPSLVDDELGRKSEE